MLEQINLNRKLSKEEYKAKKPALQRYLHQLQRACWESGVASLIVFEGWNTSGKGSIIRKLTERLEPRGFDLHSAVAARSYELQLPWLWRFWAKLPNYGHMAIFDRSWYRRVLVERLEGLTSEEEWQRAYDEIVTFERALADDRHEVIKFFLHIDKEEQGGRLKMLQDNEMTSWQVEPIDLERHERYEEFRTVTEEMLERTEVEWAPWTIVESRDKRWARIKVFETVIRRLEEGLRKRGHDVPEREEPPAHEEEIEDDGLC